MTSVIGAIVRRGGVAVAVASALLVLVWGSAPRSTDAQPAQDPALLEELATRLLSPPFPGPVGVEVPPAQLLPGALPEGLPVDLPLPPDSRLVGSIIRPIPPGPVPVASPAANPVIPTRGESIEVVLDVPSPPAAVIAFYEQALAMQGFTRPSSGPIPQPGGFRSLLGSSTPSFFCRGTEGPFLEVVAIRRRDQPTDVRVRIQGFAGPCATPPGVPPSPPPDPLPPLDPPAGVTVLVGGSGGSPLSRSSEAIAETTMSVADLEAHYAQQLVAAGWQRAAGGTAGPLAWSVWQVPDDATGAVGPLPPGERQGMLTVVAGPGAERRSLHVSVVSAGPLTAGPIPVPR